MGCSIWWVKEKIEETKVEKKEHLPHEPPSISAGAVIILNGKKCFSQKMQYPQYIDLPTCSRDSVMQLAQANIMTEIRNNLVQGQGNFLPCHTISTAPAATKCGVLLIHNSMQCVAEKH